MKADAITSRILEDARTESARIVRDTEARVKQIRQDNDAEMAKQRENALKKAQEDAVEMRDRMLRMAELDQRKEYLAMQRGVIDKAFDNALEMMRKMPVQQAQEFLLNLLAENAQGDEELIVSKQDEAIYSGTFLAQANQRLTKQGKKGNLKQASERRELGGGMVLRRGGMEINLTYAAILSEIRPTLEAETAAMLFQSGKDR